MGTPGLNNNKSEQPESDYKMADNIKSSNMGEQDRIKASELRIGNWLTNDGVNFFKVNHSDIVESHYQYGMPNSFYRPIILTEEWLLKFGFDEKIENTGAPIHEDLKSFKLDGYEFSQDCNGEWFLCGYNWNTKHFKFVHQLQNLYFALTGTELLTAPSGDKSSV